MFDPDRSTKRKFRTRNDLSVSDQEAIVEWVKNHKLTHREAAINFQVKPALVNKLVSGAKKDPEFFSASRRREEKRKNKWQLVVDAA